MSLLVVGRSRLSSGANWMVRIKFNFERRHLSHRFVFLLFLHTLSSASLEPGSHCMIKTKTDNLRLLGFTGACCKTSRAQVRQHCS